MLFVAMLMVGASFLFSKLKVIVPVSASPLSSVTVISMVKPVVVPILSKSNVSFSDTTPAENGNHRTIGSVKAHLISVAS